MGRFHSLWLRFCPFSRVCSHVCLWRPEADTSVLRSHSPPYFFGIDSQSEPEACQFGWTSWPAALRPSSVIFSSAGLTGALQHPALFRGMLVLKLGSSCLLGQHRLTEPNALPTPFSFWDRVSHSLG